jgi:hypothetical protein
MTSTNPVPSTSAPSADKASATKTSNASKKRLRSSSEGTQKGNKTAASSAACKRARKLIPSLVPDRSPAIDASTEQPRQTKASVVEALLTRERGASLEAMSEATGWQPHTCRAFLTGLRKKGREVIRASDNDGKSIYQIATERSPASSSAVAQTEAESN